MPAGAASSARRISRSRFSVCRARQQRAGAVAQQGRVERLRQRLVGAGRERHLDRALGDQADDDDRRLLDLGERPDPAADGDAVHDGQEGVEHDQVDVRAAAPGPAPRAPSEASTTSTAPTCRMRRSRSRVAESLVATRTDARCADGSPASGSGLTAPSCAPCSPAVKPAHVAPAWCRTIRLTPRQAGRSLARSDAPTPGETRMARFDFDKALRRKVEQHRKLVERKNRRLKDGNGVYDRWAHPVLTGAHAPLFWRYDLDRAPEPVPGGAARRQLRLQRRGDRVAGQGLPDGARRGQRPQELLRGGREPERRRQLPLLGPPGGDAGDGRPRHERLRHAPDGARGRLDLRDLLHRAQGPRGRAGRHLRRRSRRPASRAPRTS